MKGGKTSRPELERLNPNWPTKRVAKLIRNNLEKTHPVYHPPKVEELPPILPVTHSTKSLQNVDWDMGAARHLLCRTMFGPKYPELKEASENPMEIELSSLLSTLNPPEPPGEWVNEPSPQWDALTEEDIQELIERGPQTTDEKLRLEIFDRVNKLGIGAQGLGGLTTVVDVKIKSLPTHAASKPVAMIPNCAATRHAHFYLDGSGPAELTPPKLEDWPEVTWEVSENTRRVNLDEVTKEDIQEWKVGETVLLSGKMLTGRDAAHKRIQTMMENGEGLPEGVDLTNRFIYYVGPVDAVGDEVVGPAGPTTATRMDKFTDMMLEKTGLIGMIGKAERGPATVDSIAKHKAVYLMAVGGAAYLVSKAIKKSRVVAFEDLGMEAIYEFDVEDMPVTVAVDSTGANAHKNGPAIWKAKIEELDASLSK